MTFSPKAIEAAAEAMKLGVCQYCRQPAVGAGGGVVDCNCPYRVWDEPTDKERAQIALTAALAVDGVALQGWQDISTAPKDGTPIIGAVWKIRWADSHRIGEISRCWYQPEFDAFISSCREMTLAQGYTFENGAIRNLYSPVIEPISHWQPLPPPPAASDREERGSPPKEKL